MTAREAALNTLADYRRNKARPDISLGKLTSKMPPRDAALAKRICDGVLQNMALCDYYCAFFSSIELKKLEPRVLDILRIGIYQILFLTRVPDSAAVSEGVTLANKVANPRAAGFVNAVLRKVADASASGRLPDIKADNEFMRLSIKYSHPEWLIREFCSRFGTDASEALLSAHNAADTPVTAQVNTLLTDTDNVLTLLKREGVEISRHEWLDGCINLRGAGNIENLSVYKKGYIYIQDTAARLAVMAADPAPGGTVIDGCAAPGGKSFAAAIMMGNKGRIMSCDINPAKLAVIKNGASRLKVGIISTVERDASSQVGDDSFPADTVFADVPCSGFGIIRKKPEIRYKTKQDVAGLPDIQLGILSGLSKHVKPGGTLLYSTCTFLDQENDDVVDSFLRENSDFTTEEFSLPFIGVVPGGRLSLWPHIHVTDGFFICKLRKAL